MRGDSELFNISRRTETGAWGGFESQPYFLIVHITFGNSLNLCTSVSVSLKQEF